MQGDNHSDDVAAVKQGLELRGVPLAGDCGAFEITKRVAWLLKGEGIGLLAKPGGANCQGYAAGYLVYPGNVGVDLLRDAGGANLPQWSIDPVDPNLEGRWRAPIDPGDGVAPATPPAADPIVARLDAQFDRLWLNLQALQQQADANAAKIQQQIEQAVTSAQSTGRQIGAVVEPLIPSLIGLLGKK